MTLSFTHSLWWIVPIVIASAGLTYWMYRGTRERLSALPHALLNLFRFTVLTVLGILLLEPLLSSLTKLKFPPIVVVLQDASESLVLNKDSAYVRGKFKQDLSDFLGKLSDDDEVLQVESYRFDSEVRNGLKPDSLSFRGNGTNIGGAIEKVRDIYQNQNLGAIVVLSDGITTSGASPVYVLNEGAQPVYTVLMGDTTPQKDIKIAEVLFNEIAYLNTEIPIKVKVRADGFEAANVSVNLAQDGKVLGAKPLSLSKNKPIAEADFLIKPSKAGLQSFTVSVTQLPGEITYRNNSRTFAINVLETKVKVALFAGSAHPDMGALAEAMAHEQGYQFDQFILEKPGVFYEDPAGKNLRDYDLFILHNYPQSPADAAIVQKIAAEIKDRNAPAIFFVGMFTDLNTMRPLHEYMALAPSNINNRAEEAVLNMDAKYRSHSTFTFDDNWLNWINNTPPVFRNKSDWQPKADAEVYATCRIKGVAVSYPVFALQSHLSRKNMTFIGENFWRMRMNAFTENQSFERFDDWYFNVVKWLMVNDDKRKFRVFASKMTFSGNEPAVLKGQAYDDSYNPLAGVETNVALKAPNGKVTDYFLNETAPGQSFLEIYNLPEGNYSFTAEGTKNKQRIGTDAGQFTIGRSDIEHINLQADKETMRQMALRTGGKALHISQLSQLPDLIKKDEKLKTIVDYKKNKKPFFDYWWILAGILALLSVEWITRKWHSML